MVDNSTLPGCFALQKPLPPNRCETCPYREACGKFVSKIILQKIIDRLKRLESELEAARHGG